MAQSKKNLSTLLDSLIDEDGFKTEVTVTLTPQTLLKVVSSMLATGIAITVIAYTFKNAFPNAQLAAIQQELINIKQTLKS